jgi:hypothetical protein
MSIKKIIPSTDCVLFRLRLNEKTKNFKRLFSFQP